MKGSRLRFTAVVLLLASLAVLSGYTPPMWPFGRRSIKHVPASEFFRDPLQVQLATAVDRGDSAAVADAVRAGADIHAWGKDGYSLLYWALARRNVAGFEALLRNGANVTGDYRDPAAFRDRRHRNCIVRIIVEGADASFLRAALRQGLDPEYVLDKDSNESLLFLAARKHNEPAMQVLLECGANMERQNSLGYSPLGESMLPLNFRIVWFLLERGASPLTGSDRRSDIITQLKTYGSRGVRPDQHEYFEKVVDELVRRGLLTHQDIVEADKPKTPNPGITVIEHSADSEAGQAIMQLDQLERDANARDLRK